MQKILLAILLSYFSTMLQGQRVISTWNLFTQYNYDGDSLPVNDSDFIQSVKTLFGLSNEPVYRVLADSSDSVYYASIKGLLFYTFDTSTEEIVLVRAEHKSDGNYLKCMLNHKNPDGGIADVIAIMNLPFVIEGKAIKFKNFFKGVKAEFTGGGPFNVYTTAKNQVNLRNINSFLRAVIATYGLSIDTSASLYYSYYSKFESPYAPLGIEFYFVDFGGMTLPLSRNDYMIFDKEAGGFFKHELVHYAAHRRFHSKFFSEGFATYLGGTSPTCDPNCGYKDLLGGLEKENSDSVFIDILKGTFKNGQSYYKYFYELAAFSTYMLAQNFGDGFLNNKQLQPIFQTSSPSEINAFLHKTFDKPNLSLREHYIEELKKYVNGNKN